MTEELPGAAPSGGTPSTYTARARTGQGTAQRSATYGFPSALHLLGVVLLWMLVVAAGCTLVLLEDEGQETQRSVPSRTRPPQQEEASPAR